MRPLHQPRRTVHEPVSAKGAVQLASNASTRRSFRRKVTAEGAGNDGRTASGLARFSVAACACQAPERCVDSTPPTGCQNSRRRRAKEHGTGGNPGEVPMEPSMLRPSRTSKPGPGRPQLVARSRRGRSSSFEGNFQEWPKSGIRRDRGTIRFRRRRG